MADNNSDFKQYDLYSPLYNAEGLGLQEIEQEIELNQNLCKHAQKSEKPLIRRRIQELIKDQQRIQSYNNNKTNHLVGFCSFSNEIFKLARILSRTKDEKKRKNYDREIELLVNNLDDPNFTASHKTTRTCALRRIGILMLTEENEKVLFELKRTLYHLKEVKQGFLNPYKYYREINNLDRRNNKKVEEIKIF